MKHGKKPTVRQKKHLKACGLNPDNWLICKISPGCMTIVHRHTNTIKTVLR